MVEKIVKKKKHLNPEAEAARYMKEIPDDPKKLDDLLKVAQEEDRKQRPKIVGDKDPFE